MGNKTKIQWTDRTWNPVSGCSKVSAGCKNCYAERDFHRPYPGRAFTDVRCHPERLEQPLHWRKPQRIFVNSMSDLFHEDVPDDFLDRVFAVMALSPQHTFQILTKRAERMVSYMIDFWRPLGRQHEVREAIADFGNAIGLNPNSLDVARARVSVSGTFEVGRSPLPNVHFGVSCEDRSTLSRAWQILGVRAAVKFLSLEPLLEDLGDISSLLRPAVSSIDYHQRVGPDGSGARDLFDWVIVGGESGPNARQCNVEWIRDIVRQCQAAGVPVFVKQLGSNVETTKGLVEGTTHFGTRDRKGGDPAEWPEDLRVREFPLSLC